MSVNKVNQTTGALSPIAGGTLYADAPIGSILPYGGAAAPNGFLLCQGQSLLRTEYAELFAAIGTSFGSVDNTHFNIPDLRGKTLVGYNSSETEFNVIGKTGGEKTHKLTIAEMPAHSHAAKNASGGGDMTLLGDGTGNYNVPVSSATPSFAKVAYSYLQNTGGSGAHNNLQPYNTVNYIIKAKQSAIPADFLSKVDEACADGNIALDMIKNDSDAYKTTRSYKVGDMVIHDNMLYKCTTACSAGTWQTNQGYFTATTLTSEVTTVNASLTINTETYTGTSSAGGTLITDIGFSNNIIGCTALDNTSNTEVYSVIRKTGSGKIAVGLFSEINTPVASHNVTVTFRKLGI